LRLLFFSASTFIGLRRRLHTPDEVRRRLRRFFRRRGRPAEVPDWFELVADLPLSRHGKVPH